MTYGDWVIITKTMKVGKIRRIEWDIDGPIFVIKLNDGKIVECRKSEVTKIKNPVLFV